jgi:hypothetical protein
LKAGHFWGGDQIWRMVKLDGMIKFEADRGCLTGPNYDLDSQEPMRSFTANPKAGGRYCLC